LRGFCCFVKAVVFMNWLLKIIEREDQRVVQKHIIPPSGSLRIGRNSQLCDVALEDKSLSRQHFSVVSDPAGLVVHDLNSTLGTFVNGRKIVTGGSEMVPGAAPEQTVSIEAGKRYDFELTCLAPAGNAPSGSASGNAYGSGSPSGSAHLPAGSPGYAPPPYQAPTSHVPTHTPAHVDAPSPHPMMGNNSLPVETHTIGLDQPIGRPIDYAAPISAPISGPISGTPTHAGPAYVDPLHHHAEQPYHQGQPAQPGAPYPGPAYPNATNQTGQRPPANAADKSKSPPASPSSTAGNSGHASGPSNYTGKLDLGQLSSLDENDFADENW
jgi:hypothetical protein